MSADIKLMPVVPLPTHLNPLPPLLTWTEVVAVLAFWNLGGRNYARDLRAIGVLASVNEFPDGPYARYAPEAVLAIYPVKRGG
jgi:hypothetical protein